MASYPGSVANFTTKNDGEVVYGSHVNALQDEVKALETSLGLVPSKMTFPWDGSSVDLGTLSARVAAVQAGAPVAGVQATVAQAPLGSGLSRTVVAYNSTPFPPFPSSMGPDGAGNVYIPVNGVYTVTANVHFFNNGIASGGGFMEVTKATGNTPTRLSGGGPTLFVSAGDTSLCFGPSWEGYLTKNDRVWVSVGQTSGSQITYYAQLSVFLKRQYN
jgi:hypothetical protein